MFVPTGAMKTTLRFLRHENGLDVYHDVLTGKELYVGRTTDLELSLETVASGSLRVLLSR